MSKLKLSFSFILMLFLVGMFSAAAFAAGSTTPLDGRGVVNGLAPDDTTHDNSIINDNQTGVGVGGQTANFNNVIKSDDMVKDNAGNHGTQRTHGSYMNNTNSCASCHQTHTGAGAALLFKDSQYATCTACHDGTLGFYNVMAAGSDSAGTFGGTHDGNMSAHLANGTIKISAAPGGNHTPDVADTESWNPEFSCASCHAPHGSYSDRLLNEDPNGMANTPIQEGGLKVDNVPVVTDITAKLDSATVNYTDVAGNPQTYNYVAYLFKVGDPGAVTNTIKKYDSAQAKVVDVDQYALKGLTTGDTVLQIMKWDVTAGVKVAGVPVGAYVVDQAPWMHEYDFDASHTKHYWTAFKDSTGKEVLDTDMLKKGEVLGAGFAGVQSSNSAFASTAPALVTTFNSLTTGKVARSYVVKLDVSDLDANNVATTTVSTLWASKLANGSTNPKYVANRGVAMSGFCAACHTDYLAKSGTQSGTFDHAYRHTTNSDTYTCVRCHYAHGTDVTIMRDARGLTYNTILGDTTNYFPTVTDPAARETVVKDYLIDKNPSSALKRYTNMAVCWGCHTSSHSGGTRNTDTYQYNTTPGVDSDRNGIEFDY